MSLDLFQIRRELHSIPELAFSEHKTKALLLGYLNGIEGIRVHEFKLSTGLLVEYSGGEGPYRLFRADMDALPIEEETGCEFSSTHPGLMHACGHDIHMTVLLGLIERVARRKPERNLLFLFQPAEEGKGGAEMILEEGLIQGFPVSGAFALHAASGLPVGSVSSREGVFFGIPQEFDVTFQGVSSHAAYPDKGVNALLTAVDFVSLMQADIADLAHHERVIWHIGRMEGGSVRNVVADRCKLEGTQRTLDKSVRDLVNGMILANCGRAAEKTGAQYNVDFLCTYDPVVNTGKLVAELEKACADLGISYEEAEIALTGEDFGFFTSLYPGLLFWLGSGCEQSLHSGMFLADEACIPVGIDVMEQLALKH